MSEALAVLERVPEGETPSALMRRATDVAGVCREIVMRTAMDLQGKKYVKVEGWMSIAAAYGCVPSIREVVEEERGIRAVAELRRHDGVTIAAAEGFCGLDEPRWANQPMYARRGMAQTRAISRVCRSVFAFCVVLIDENLSTTPAEEIPHGGGASDVVDVVAKPTARSGGVRDASTKIPYGKSKGKYLADVPDDDVSWLLGAAKKSVDANDPKWHAKNVQWLEACQAEAQRRVGESGRVVAPVEASPRAVRAPKQAELPTEDEGEEIVTPTMAFARLAREFRVSQPDLAKRALGAVGKSTGLTHADIAILRTSLEAVPQR
jgi:hypothetical protein